MRPGNYLLGLALSGLACSPYLLCDEVRAQSNVTARTPSYVNSYILGPGDVIAVELVNVPEISGNFSIGPDGILYLPRLRSLVVQGLTVDELKYFLQEQYAAFVRNPVVYIRPIRYRPVSVYVGGEVQRPGYYTLLDDKALGVDTSKDSSSVDDVAFSRILFPKLFDALQAAQGVTPYSNLSDIKVTRKTPLSADSRRVEAVVDLLALLKQGDETSNIRLFDGDSIFVGKSSQIMLEQLVTATRTNLSPSTIEVYVTGRVKEPGGFNLPQGSSLLQAINRAGGPSFLRGKVEFIRFSRNGEVDRRLFKYDPTKAIDSYSNPILLSGDIIRIRESFVSAGTSLLNEVTGPFVGIYSVYSLFR